MKRVRQQKAEFIDLEIKLKEIILERDKLGLTRDQQWIRANTIEIFVEI